MEKQFLFFDTGKGCLLALVLYTTVMVLLGLLFSQLPQSWWLQILIGFPVIAVVTRFVLATDRKSKLNRK